MVVFVCVFVDNSTLKVSVAVMRPSWVKESLFLRVDLALSSSKDGRVGMINIEFFPACAGTPRAGAMNPRTAAPTIAGWSKLYLTMIAVWIKCSICSHRREFLPARSAEKSNEGEGQRAEG